MERRFFVSYGPTMVYSKDKQVLLSKTDIDRILVETDGPVRFSRCFANNVAQISFLPSVVFCASKVLRQTYEQFSKTLEQNSNEFVGI
jgi:TatD DNase family protein